MAVHRALITVIDNRTEDSNEFGDTATMYEVDLATDEARYLRHELARYVALRGGQRPERFMTDSDAHAVRLWARRKGIAVGERGRIARDIVAKYHAEQHREDLDLLASAAGNASSGDTIADAVLRAAATDTGDDDEHGHGGGTHTLTWPDAPNVVDLSQHRLRDSDGT